MIKDTNHRYQEGASLVLSQSTPHFCIVAPTMEKAIYTQFQGLNNTETTLEAPSSLPPTPAARGR